MVLDKEQTALLWKTIAYATEDEKLYDKFEREELRKLANYIWPLEEIFIATKPF